MPIHRINISLSDKEFHNFKYVNCCIYPEIKKTTLAKMFIMRQTTLEEKNLPKKDKRQLDLFDDKIKKLKKRRKK